MVYSFWQYCGSPLHKCLFIWLCFNKKRRFERGFAVPAALASGLPDILCRFPLWWCLLAAMPLYLRKSVKSADNIPLIVSERMRRIFPCLSCIAPVLRHRATAEGGPTRRRIHPVNPVFVSQRAQVVVHRKTAAFYWWTVKGSVTTTALSR